MVKQGLSAEEAASRFYVLDHHGLITAQVHAAAYRLAPGAGRGAGPFARLARSGERQAVGPPPDGMDAHALCAAAALRPAWRRARSSARPFRAARRPVPKGCTPPALCHPQRSGLEAHVKPFARKDSESKGAPPRAAV